MEYSSHDQKELNTEEEDIDTYIAYTDEMCKYSRPIWEDNVMRKTKPLSIYVLKLHLRSICISFVAEALVYIRLIVRWVYSATLIAP